jgi:radical SAM superfamily enzyme YgiQ (UPF0313 family)
LKINCPCFFIDRNGKSTTGQKKRRLQGNDIRTMKACFINPPVQDFYTTSIRRQPLGLLYVMASVRSAGYESSFINGHSLKKSIVPLPDEFSYLKKYMDQPDQRLLFPFKNFSHFGLSFQEIERRIRGSQADVFFIPSMFTPYHREAERIISMVRGVRPGALIVTGGYHAALYPEYHLNEAGADFVVRGEGEESSTALMRALSRGGTLTGVPNLVYKAGGSIMYNDRRNIAAINTLPLPARDYLTKRDFKAYGRIAVSMIASRGCPNRCGFCTVRAVWGAGYRGRSAESVIAEIRECVELYHASMINFEDDNLFDSRDRAAGLLEALIRFQDSTGGRLDLTAMNGISLEALDDGIVGLMSRAGFDELNISLMSRSAELQKKQMRPFDSEQFGRIARAARRLDMNVRAYFILGLPGQTKEEVLETIAFLRGLDVKFFPSVYYNVNAPKNEWMIQRSSAFYNETDELSRDDLVMLFNECMEKR